MNFIPLTPSLRLDIFRSFNKTISELQSCEMNELVKMQIEALEIEKKLINALPDGYPMPLKSRKR